MKLIIAEKPSLGRSIAAAIPGNATGKDPIYKGEYCITWLYGHILELKEPNDYNEKYQKWNLEQLPIYFENWEHKPAEGKEDRVAQIGNLLSQAEMVIHAGDPDDEGQLLVDEILRWFQFTGPVKRLDTANTTEAALKRALDKMTDNGPREIDGWAAHARSIADLMVGVNMSRFFTCMNQGKTLSVGRVQTPTLGLVVNRDLLIEGHQKLQYYVISCCVKIDGYSIPCTFQMPKDDQRLTDGKLLNQALAEELAAKLNEKQLDKIIISKKQEVEHPPLPFNLVKLQTYCGNAWGYDPQKVMDITQKLKDSGAITYNRSDCQYLSEDHFKEAPYTIRSVGRNLGALPPQLDTSIKSQAFNDKYITAHFAIIPTDSKQNLDSFTEEERNVYEIIAKYYLIQFMPDCKKVKTQLQTDVPELGTITASAIEIIDQGFHQLIPVKNESTSILSAMPEGTYTGTVTNTNVQQKETKPPARYTKTSLNEDMTRIAKYVESEEVRKLLLEKDKDKKGENGSIGTSATRATIIDTLILRGFLEEKNKRLISTEMGREFYRVLPDELKKADMTAYWWVIQEQIKAREIPYSALPEAVLDTIRTILTHDYPRLASAAKLPTDRTVVGRCPKCGGYVVEGVKGFGCMNYRNGCQFTIWKQSKGSLLKNVTITAKMAESLLQGDTIESKKLYSEKTNSTFFGGLKLDLSNDTYAGGLSFIPLEKAPIGTCPRCGGDIVEGKSGFGCRNYASGCKFIIWKNQKSSLFRNISITESIARKLLLGETIQSKKLYSEKSNCEFFGGYKLNDTGAAYGATLALVTDIERPSIGTCPRCQKPVTEGKNGFGCTGYAEGCRFVIWKKQKSSVFKKITISESTAKKLLQGETITTRHLYSEKNNTEFWGGYRMNDTGKDYGADIELVMDLERPAVGPCPRCGGKVYEYQKCFQCENAKDSCSFILWKETRLPSLKKISFSENMVKKLLSGESIQSNRISVTGYDTTFSGTIRLNNQANERSAQFIVSLDTGKKLGQCPRCGKTIYENPIAFQCSGEADGCRYIIRKKPSSKLFSNIEIDFETASALLNGQTLETDQLCGSDDTRLFSGKYRLTDFGSDYGPELEYIRQ